MKENIYILYLELVNPDYPQHTNGKTYQVDGLEDLIYKLTEAKRSKALNVVINTIPNGRPSLYEKEK